MSKKWKKNGHADSVLNKSETSNIVPWPEWSDVELNAEQWDYPKGGTFVDSDQIVMPRSLKAHEWKRFEELNYNDSPVVYEAISSYPDLVTKNRHIIHSEFIRCFISTLINLQYRGGHGLEIENPSSNFSWNFGDQCWQGWYYVYSLNKAGKGIPHRPVYNRNGKYIVRIFHMGCWRRIYIDDLIPVDKKNRPLLPRTGNVNELWPMILAKAMLKIASLSWTEEREIVDCSLITCLTGWIELSLDVAHLSPHDQWEFLLKYTKRFDWSRNENSPKDRAKSDVQEKSGKSRKSKNTATKIEIPDDTQSILIFLSVEDTRNINGEDISGIIPCWDHQIYVEMSRDLPLDPTQQKAPLAKWKNHRWLDWAIRRGLIDASDYFMPVRLLLVVSPLGHNLRGILYVCPEIGEEGDEGEDEVSSETNFLQRSKRLDKTSSSRAKSRDSDMPDISMWQDFNKLSCHIRTIHLFYRRKHFEYSIEVSDAPVISSISDRKKSISDYTTKDIKKISARSFGPTSNPEKIHQYQDKVWRSRNEPLYLFVDSINEKLILVNFSTRDVRDSAMKRSSLVVERHDWFETLVDDDPIGSIRTRGTKSMIFQLEPGRHLLRIFINFQSSYRAVLLSDAPFEIGNRLKMHRLMIAESRRIDRVAKNISHSMITVFESFGTSNYATDLKTFYRSYMPASSIVSKHPDKKSIKSIHNYLIDELFRLIEKRFPPDDLPLLRRAVRVFFLDPSIGKTAKISPENPENGKNDAGKLNSSATIVQSFFRMALMKVYKKIHEPSHVEHDRVKDALRKIVQIFDHERNQDGANTLLREMLKRDENFSKLYAWTKDLRHVIEVREFCGRVRNSTTDRWIPIVRTRVNTDKFQSVFAAVDLFTDTIDHTVRVLENDSHVEMPRVANNVTPNRYSYRENGYTIFAHGHGNFQGHNDHEWLLHLTTVKGFPVFRCLDETEVVDSGKIDVPPLRVREMTNTYAPNLHNSILKLMVGIKTRTLLSIRLKTSYENVLVKLLVSEENDEILREAEGGWNLVVPLIFLDSTSAEKIDSDDSSRERRKSIASKSVGSLSSARESNDEEKSLENFTRYKIEARVIKDSWPLNAAEWRVVLESRIDGSTDLEMNRGSLAERRSRKTMSKKSLENVELKKPYWILQLVTEMENELEVIRDTGRDEKILEFREKWKIDESESLERGEKLRRAFLDANNMTTVERSAIDRSSSSTIDIEEMEESVNVDFRSSADEISALNERTHAPPANLVDRLPKLDLAVYMEKEDEEEDRWVKSDFDEETLRNQRAMNLLDFEQLQTSFIEESSMIMDKVRKKYRQIARRYFDNRDHRYRNGNEIRFIRQTRANSTKNTASVKSKDSTKSKKTS